MKDTKDTKDAKELMKDLFYMQVGALASVVERISDNADEFKEKGKEVVSKGKNLNEELKHKVAEFIDEKKTDEDKEDKKKDKK